ncbi:MAG: helix-turn-helix domain-containing protein [Deltaproteobacteria bacterium]|jgi:excisionase family DNA binding protein
MRKYARNKQKSIGRETLSREEGEVETGYVRAPLVTVGEAAKYLGVSRRNLYLIMEMGKITAVKTVGATLVEKKSLDEFRASGMLT